MPIRIRPSVEQSLHDFKSTAIGGRVQRRHPCLEPTVDRPRSYRWIDRVPVPEEPAHSKDGSGLRRAVQRRYPGSGLGCDLGARRDEDLDDLAVPSRAREVKGRRLSIHDERRGKIFGACALAHTSSKTVTIFLRETDGGHTTDLRPSFDEGTYTIRVASQRGEVHRGQAAVICIVDVCNRKRRTLITITRECREVAGGQSHAARRYHGTRWNTAFG